MTDLISGLAVTPCVKRGRPRPMSAPMNEQTASSRRWSWGWRLRAESRFNRALQISRASIVSEAIASSMEFRACKSPPESATGWGINPASHIKLCRCSFPRCDDEVVGVPCSK